MYKPLIISPVNIVYNMQVLDLLQSLYHLVNPFEQILFTPLWKEHGTS